MRSGLWAPRHASGGGAEAFGIVSYPGKVIPASLDFPPTVDSGGGVRKQSAFFARLLRFMPELRPGIPPAAATLPPFSALVRAVPGTNLKGLKGAERPVG